MRVEIEPCAKAIGHTANARGLSIARPLHLADERQDLA